MLGINQKLREHWHSLTTAEKAAYKTTSTTADSLAAIVPPSSMTVDTPTTTNATQPAAASQPPATGPSSSNTVTSSVLQRGQTTIHKCGDCGRMFFTQETLQTHRRAEHGAVAFVIDSPSNAARNEIEEVIEDDDSTPEQVNIISIILFFNDLFSGFALVQIQE